jgi:hypothetical protein
MKHIWYAGLISIAMFFFGAGCSDLSWLWESSESEQKADTVSTVQENIAAGEKVYIVKINRSDAKAASTRTGSVAVASARAGTGEASTGEVAPFSRNAGTVSSRYRMGHPGQAEINRQLQSHIQNGTNARSLHNVERSAASLNATRNFWVETTVNGGGWTQKPAVLRATGTYCNVWIANENYDAGSSGTKDNKLTAAQAQALAEKFDQIYAIETPIFGYEYGGGPGGNGGVDGDPKIQIFVFDIDGDAFDTAKTGVTMGFFNSLDYYAQNVVDQEEKGWKSNEAELFYIDSFVTDETPDQTYSTLVHEFQHMINFNVKYIAPSQAGKRVSFYDTWYTEMLSMLAEDMIGPMIGIPAEHTAHPINLRIPLFLGAYPLTGVNEWNTQDGDMTLISYSNVYAFGAYLARNYGGPELIKAIAQNDAINTASITAGLSRYGIDFKQALSAYGEAIVKSGFNKSVSAQISGRTYTFSGFDIWNMLNYFAGQPNGLPEGYKGPFIGRLNSSIELPGNSLIVERIPDDIISSGQINLTITKPSDIDIFVYVK